MHIIATDGCFDDQNGFIVGPQNDPNALELTISYEK